MRRDWQDKRDIYLNTLKPGASYEICNCFGAVVIAGTYENYEKGRYLFRKPDGLYRVNLNKLKLPVGIRELCAVQCDTMA